jgi:spore germination cell wall hydrolase CwlJ-like protein
MTENLDKLEGNSDLPNYLRTAVIIFMMVIGVFFSAKLLLWTIDNKFSKITPMEESQITAELRDRQLACLAKNIYHEAGNEPFEGKVAVAQVTINRTESGKFPGDICKTIYQKNVVYEKTVCQFSWYCDRESHIKPLNKAVYEECMTVAKKVLMEGFRLPGLTNALYYHADYINPGWNREKVAKVGRHIFYR